MSAENFTHSAKWNSYSFNGGNSIKISNCQNCFTSLQKKGLLRKEFALLGSKFFPFSVDSSSEGAWCAGKQTESKKVFSPWKQWCKTNSQSAQQNYQTADETTSLGTRYSISCWDHFLLRLKRLDVLFSLEWSEVFLSNLLTYQLYGFRRLYINPLYIDIQYDKILL